MLTGILQDAPPPDDGLSCFIEVEFSLSRDGVVDPAFESGSFVGKQVRVLVLTGAGEKTFCAGASLQQLGAGQLSGDSFQAMTVELANLAIPTICALNGNVFGELQPALFAAGVWVRAGAEYVCALHPQHHRMTGQIPNRTPFTS